MRFRFRPRVLHVSLAAAAVVAALLAVAVAELPTRASAPPPSLPPALALGLPYAGPIAPGADVRIGFTSLPGSGTIEILGVGSGGTVLARETIIPTPAERHSGRVEATLPASSGPVSYWVAVDPAAQGATIRLLLSPSGTQQAGTPLATTLTGVPAGDFVYLVGTKGGGAGFDASAITDYVPPTACTPNPSTGGMVICNFTAPQGYGGGDISFAAYTTNGAAGSLPENHLPEVPVAAVLPVIAIAAGAVAMRRLRASR